MTSPPHSLPSMFGGIGYPPSHPSRWAGYEAWGMARLTVVQDCVVLSPLWPWRRLLRMPISAVEGASRITFGIRFSVPTDAALDGTRFKRWYGGGETLERLVESLQSRGVTVQTMPPSERVKGFVRDFAVAQRPGWIWRDRSWLGFLESAVSLAIVLAILFLVGFFSNLPTVMLAWIAFVVAVIVWGCFAGYRQRKKVSR